MNKIHVQYSNRRVRRKPDALLSRLIRAMAIEANAPIIIAIGGPGGSGKSTLARKIAGHLKKGVSILNLDDYKTPRQTRSAQNIFGAHPQANKMDLIKTHLTAIKKGKSFNKPVYCRKEGMINRFKEFIPQPVTVVEGEVATYKLFRSFASLNIFVDAHWETLLKARIIRDIEKRGYDKDKAIATFLHSNLREFGKYGAESKKHADIHIYCDEDFNLFVESIEQNLFGKYLRLFETAITPITLKKKALDVPVPFDEKGRIDLKYFAECLNKFFHQGVHRVIIGHYCQEGQTLTRNEHKELLQSACEFFPGEIIFYTPAGSLPDTRYLCRAAFEYGADKIIVDLKDLKKKFKSGGVTSYKMAFAPDKIPVGFTLPKTLPLLNNPKLAKRKAAGMIAGFPQTCRPPF